MMTLKTFAIIAAIGSLVSAGYDLRYGNYWWSALYFLCCVVACAIVIDRFKKGE